MISVSPAAPFSARDATSRTRLYATYLRGWLPPAPSARILDIGCGTGELLQCLAAMGYSDLTGVDISCDRIAVAKALCQHVICVDALEYLKTSDESFDLITAMDVVEHLPKGDGLTLMNRCFAKLRRGGRLVLQTPNADSPWHGSVLYGDMTHETAYTPRLLATLLAQAGFTEMECRECGPVATHSVVSACRAALWRIVRLAAMLFNAVETGSTGQRILTRVFLMTGRKAGIASET